MRFIYWLKDLKGKIKYHPNHLHIKTLKRGWTDCDHQMLHACMQILVNFVENEKIGGIVDWEYDEDHKRAAQVMDRLYYWWKYDPFAQDATIMPVTNDWLLQYDIEIDPFATIEDWIDDIYTSIPESKWVKQVVEKCRKMYQEKNESYRDYNRRCYYMCLNYIEMAAIERQQQALKDLIEIRGYMWT